MSRSCRLWIVARLWLVTLAFLCQAESVRAVEMAAVMSEEAPRALSAYGLFENGPQQVPSGGVVPYSLNTPLFTDYANKYRFVFVPPGAAAQYHDRDVFAFPVGTVLVKTFAYPTDNATIPNRLIETRLLIRKQHGWVALPYVWNDTMTDAVLAKAGKRLDVSWVGPGGEPQRTSYKVPNVNQCKGCHVQGDALLPIGPKARHLNEDGQLQRWARSGLLVGLPDDPADIPRVPVWDDPRDSALDKRARAYLDINCAHCHTPGGPGDTSGLYLEYWRTDTVALGVGKRPVAAGRGTGGRPFGIDAGRPENSILLFRMESVDPGIMMPELGRSLVHQEGVALIREWISQMPLAD
jgi:uncharacterized repeat protein (TIGR03806 family)